MRWLELAAAAVATFLLGVIAYVLVRSLEMVDPSVPGWLESAVVVATAAAVASLGAAAIGALTDRA